MKKLSYILLFAVMAFAVSCHKDDDTLQRPEDDAWIMDVSLPVPIRFGSGSMMTKATDNTKAEFSVGDKIGVISLSRETSKDNLILLNESVSAKITDEKNIEFTTPQYYPLNSSDCYDFYAYFPFEAGSGVDATKYDATRKIYYKDFYGIKDRDILFAKAMNLKDEEAYRLNEDGFRDKYVPAFTPGEGKNPIEGYNAKYIRAIKDDANYIPNLYFEHVLTALNFKVSAIESEILENLEVNAITIKETYSDVTLVIAARYGSAYKAGQVIPVSASAKKDVAIKNLTLKPTLEGVEVGTMFLYPSASYKAELTITAKNGKVHTIEVPLSITGGYQAGTKYLINIGVHDLELVKCTYSLEPMNSVEQNIEIE